MAEIEGSDFYMEGGKSPEEALGRLMARMAILGLAAAKPGEAQPGA